MIATMAVSPPISRNMNSAGAPLPLIPRRIPSSSRSRSAPSSPPDESSMTPIKVVVHHSTPTLGADSDSSSSSSSSSPDPTHPLRTKRRRGVRSAVRPPEHSTPTPAVHEARLERHRQPPPAPPDDSTPRRPSLLYTPGISLRLATQHLKKPRNVSESHLRAATVPGACPAALTTSQSQPRLIRKKSGQLVKSSLKSSKSLSIVTSRGTLATKSEPATPTHAKAVHFDAQLEHVKLFLAEQKPLAVSRDGSPTEDTSGTDTDFPSFVFGGAAQDVTAHAQRRNLVMHTPNVPLRRDANADVVLEELELAPDALSIVGRVRVRNIAYAKSVIARFTFDAWQTTSEVSARYTASRTPEVDVFVFSIRLNDLLARIEGKRMWLAVRYVVGEREVWDNNAGRDYLAEFSLMKAPPPVSAPASMKEWDGERGRDKQKGQARAQNRDDPSPSSSSSSATAESDIADLRSKLEKVVVQPVRPPAPPPSTTTTTFTMRYDFGASLAHPWVPPASASLAHAFSTPRPNAHVRTQSYPASSSRAQHPHPRPASFPPAANSIPWPEKAASRRTRAWTRSPTPPLGSPRDIRDEDGADADAHAHALFAKHRRFDDEDVPFAVPMPMPVPVPVPVLVAAPHAHRNHRRGYFHAHAHAHLHLDERTGMKRTRPLALELDAAETETEVEVEVETETTPMPGRFYSFPPVEPRGLGFSAAAYEHGQGHGQGQGDSSTASESSALSTPSLGSSRETSPSPTMDGWEREGVEVEVEVGKEGLDVGVEEGKEGQGMSPSPSETYREFLSKFCFFTGSHQLPAYPNTNTDSTSPPPNNNAHTRAHTHPHLTRKTFIDVPRPRPLPQSQSQSQGQTGLPTDEPYLLVASPLAVSPSASLSPSLSMSMSMTPSPRSGSATPQAASPPGSGSALDVNVPGHAQGPMPMPMPMPPSMSVLFRPKAVAV